MRSPTSSAQARPVDTGERVILLDTLRGFAVCGVMMANVYWLTRSLTYGRAQPMRRAPVPEGAVNA